MASSTPGAVLYTSQVYLAVTLTLLLCSSGVMAQSTETAARPDRGAMPNGSYSVSDLENISLQNGNVNLSIPLASLPAIAGGKLSWTINASYNSKLWNIIKTEADADDSQYHPYVVDTPQLSELGGWRIGGQYQLTIRNAHYDFDYLVPDEGKIPYTEYYLRFNYNWYKVVLSMPDGSEHELRPLDYAPYSAGDVFLQGYYKEIPTQMGTMRYYSSDGSFLYAQVTNEQNWTVLMPDGTKIIQTPDGIQRVQDTNGNKIKIFTNSDGTHYQDEQTGREIRYSFDPAANGGYGQGRVWYQTVGGAWMHVDINFGSTLVEGKVYRVKDSIPFSFVTCPRYNQLVSTEVPVIREIVLPQTETDITRKFTFSYNSDAGESVTSPAVNFVCNESPGDYTRTISKGWGELSRVKTPSKAEIEYSYNTDATHSLSQPDKLAEAYVTQKKVIHDGTSDIWTYSVSNTGGSVTNPDGSTLTEYKYSHRPGFSYSFGKTGLVFRSTRPFTRIDRHWTVLQFTGASVLSPGGSLDVNPVVDVEYTTLLDANNNMLKMSAKAFQYDYNGHVTQTTEYDWFDPALVSRDGNGVPTGVPASATVLRVTNNSYYNPATTADSGNVYAKRSLSNPTSPLILDALKESTIGASQTHFSYDGQAYGTAPTIGNLTNQARWDNVTNSWISASTTFDAYGNVATTTDPRGNVTQVFYDDSTHALPTRVIVDPQNGTGQQVTARGYDPSTGAVLSQTDPNGAVSTIDYTNQLLMTVDPFARPGIVYSPAVSVNGTSQRRRVTTFYEDEARRVTVAADLNTEGDGLLKSRTTQDELGRTILSEQSENGSTYTISSQTAYEQAGKIVYVSNPTRGDNAPTDGWTRSTQDSLGRVVEVVTFSGAARPTATQTTNSTGVVTTVYDGNYVIATDQAGKVRRSKNNAIGLLVRVDEPDANNNLGNIDNPTQPTSYVGSSRVDLQACKLEYSIVSPK